MMQGNTDLASLLIQLRPSLDDDEFTFVTLPSLPEGDDGRLNLRELNPAAVVQEPEGWTLVLRSAQAESLQLAGSGRFRRITLQVHSSLQAVGLTAAVSRALTDQGISANVIAGYFHDHLFVPVTQAEQALETLLNLSERVAQAKPGDSS